MPGGSAGIPADEHVRGNEGRDTFEDGVIDVAVDPELADGVALDHDRDAGPSRLVGIARLGAEVAPLASGEFPWPIP